MKNSSIDSGFRYLAPIISQAVWPYVRFSLNVRNGEEFPASRGIIVTDETVRQWTLKFGQLCAHVLCRTQPKRVDKWHLDEMMPTIKGAHHDRWRAVIRTARLSTS